MKVLEVRRGNNYEPWPECKPYTLVLDAVHGFQRRDQNPFDLWITSYGETFRILLTWENACAFYEHFGITDWMSHPRDVDPDITYAKDYYSEESAPDRVYIQYENWRKENKAKAEKDRKSMLDWLFGT